MPIAEKSENRGVKSVALQCMLHDVRELREFGHFNPSLMTTLRMFVFSKKQ